MKHVVTIKLSYHEMHIPFEDLQEASDFYGMIAEKLPEATGAEANVVLEPLFEEEEK